MHKLYTMAIIHQPLKKSLSLFFNKTTYLLNIYILEFILQQPYEQKELGLSAQDVSALKINLNQRKNNKHILNIGKWLTLTLTISFIVSYIIFLLLFDSYIINNRAFIINILDTHLNSLLSNLAVLYLDIITLMINFMLIYAGGFQIINCIKDWFSDKLYITIFDEILHTNYVYDHNLTKLLTKYDYDRYQRYYLHHLLPDGNIYEHFLKPQNFLLVKTCNSFLIFNKKSTYNGFYNTFNKSDQHNLFVHSKQKNVIFLKTFLALLAGMGLTFLCVVGFLIGPLLLVLQHFSNTNHTSSVNSLSPKINVLTPTPVIDFKSPIELFTVINRKDINEKDFFNKYSFKYIATYDPDRGLISESWDDDLNV